MNGLDPEGIRWVRYLLRDLAADGRTVLVSSHLINEMALTAERLVVIGRGRLIADTSVEEFTAQSQCDSVRVVTPTPTRFVSELSKAGAQPIVAADKAIVVNGMAAAQIGELAMRRSLTLHELTPVRASLEDAFMELTSDDVEFRSDSKPRVPPRLSPTERIGHDRRHCLRPDLSTRRSPAVRQRRVGQAHHVAVDEVDAPRDPDRNGARDLPVRSRGSGGQVSGSFDPTNVSLAGLALGSLIIGILGVLSVSGEYGSGTMRSSLVAMPRRAVLLRSEGHCPRQCGPGTGVGAQLRGLFRGQAVLAGAAPTATLADPAVLRVLIESGAYLALLTLFGVGISAIIRHGAGAIGVFVGCTFLLPVSLQGVAGNPGRFMPELLYGDSIAAVNPVNGSPSSTVGLFLMTLYAAVALGIGGALLRRRDA